MGTRNLTCVFLNGEYKIAQYGQWDGYPSGQGATVLNFLKKTNLSKFKEKVKKVKFLTDAEVGDINDKYGENWKEHYPQLSRDQGAEILNFVDKGTEELVDNLSFADNKRGFGCEFCYVVDFDNNSFESYTCHRSSPFFDDNNDRFENLKLMKTYSLDQLPTEKEFVDTLEPSDEE
jgi:hypothetical protein